MKSGRSLPQCRRFRDWRVRSVDRISTTILFLMSVAPIYFILFGSVAEIFGILGWVRAKSRASLVAGLASGLLLTGAGLLGLLQFERPGLWLGGVVSLLLLGRFLPAFLRTKVLYPSGVMAGMALAGVLLAALGLTR